LVHDFSGSGQDRLDADQHPFDPNGNLSTYGCSCCRRTATTAVAVYGPEEFVPEVHRAWRSSTVSGQAIRIATFNLESLDNDALTLRIAGLWPALDRLRADILCLQEVNGQRASGGRERRLTALSALIADTRYAAYQMVSTLTVEGHPAERHNLVILSRLPLLSRAQIRHDIVERPLYRPVTASPRSDRPEPIEWERPLLHAEIAVGTTSLHVINLHLRAPLAAPVAGQKLAPFSWRTVGGWAEGFFLAGVKRAGQALEARLLTERLLDADPDALVVVAGDLNADIYEVPLRILRAEPGDVGNATISSRALFPVEDLIPPAQRFTVLHHGRRLMLDHLLVSAKLRTYLTRAESLNQGLADEAESSEHDAVGGSFHAPLLAEFVLPVSPAPVCCAIGSTANHGDDTC
jgi:endonuclease/exonuclease/phosphatase family metal-dependent hydrolase